MEASKKQISDIFNRNRMLEIPFFQRSYVWGEDQWERFMDDLMHISNDKKPHFFGSLILKQQETPTQDGIGDVRTVIDGQQRLTTLVIFFKILSLLKKDKHVFDTFQLRKFPVALRHNHNDIDSFEKIAKSTEKIEYTDDEVTASKIIGAYKFFMDNIDIDKADEDVILQNVVFVVVDLSKGDDEQQIFDTLNSLGVRLTTAELLKNFLFRRDEIELYKTHWREVFEKDDETKKYWDREIYTGRDWRTFIDLFFYAYLQIKVQNEGDKISTKDREEFPRLENLFSSYKKLLNNYKFKKENILKEIKAHANVFRENLDNGVVNASLEKSPRIQRINAIIFGLGTTTLIPYVLYVVKNASDNSQREKLFRAIESYVMRRLVVRANNRGYNQIFLRMIGERILTEENFYKFIDERSSIINGMPNDNDLKEGFDTSKLVNKNALGILYFIESNVRDDGKYATALLGMDTYSLEHLMPKNWEKHWGKLEEQQADARKKKLLTLGNLAIITQKLNSSIRDAKWSIKIKGRGNHDGLKTYAAGINIHKDFLGESEWNEGKITSRAKSLLKKAKNIWPVE